MQLRRVQRAPCTACMRSYAPSVNAPATALGSPQAAAAAAESQLDAAGQFPCPCQVGQRLLRPFPPQAAAAAESQLDSAQAEYQQHLELVRMQLDSAQREADVQQAAWDKEMAATQARRCSVFV